jgi:Fic family protein
MLNQGYWITQYLTVSNIIRKAPIQYYRAFKHCELDECDATYFILYHLEVIDRAIREFHQYVSRKQDELASASRLLRNYPALNYRQQALLAHALREPDAQYTHTSHATSHNVSYQTARTDLQELASYGLLTEIRGRPIRYVPPPDLHDRIREGMGRRP